MRARELFRESDYLEDLRSEVITLLAAVSAEGINQVDTQNLLRDLEQQGFAIDEQSLLGLLDEIEIVQTASSDTIEIATSDVDMMVGQDADEIEADRVDSLATKKATDDIGDDL